MPFIGLEECARRLDEKGWDAWEEVTRAFWLECLVILKESMEIVPVYSGRLRATAPIVSHLEKSSTSATAILGYGTEYALRIHEDMTINHPIHKDPHREGYYNCGGRSKYLEIPIMHHAPNIPKNIVARLGMGGYEPADTSGMMTI